MSDNNRYFFAAPRNEIAKELYSRVDTDRALDAPAARLRDIYARAYLYAYGQDFAGVSSTSRISRGGDQGELAIIRVNYSRAFAQSLLSLILSSKIVWEAMASNSDYESEAQRIIASTELETYWKDLGVSMYYARALEEAIYFSECFVYRPWNKSLGEDIKTAPILDAQGRPVGFEKTGDIDFRTLSTWDVIRDPYKRSFKQLDWVILELRENRFNLAAEVERTNPQLAQQIRECGSDINLKEDAPLSPAQRDTTDITIYHAYHKRTAALPDGREVFFINGDIYWHDTALSYDNIPLDRVFASDMVGTPYAYTPFWETLGIQELVDSLESSIASNQTTFGTQMVAAPIGTNVSPESFGGMKLLLYPAGSGTPQGLNLTSTPPELFNHVKQKVSDMEQLMGLNPAVRGIANSGEQSGSSQALLANQAKTQASPLEGNYLRAVRDGGQGMIDTLRRKCSVEKTVAIVGKANKALVKVSKYNPAKTFADIHRVQVDIGNPLAQTIQGRKEMADMLLQALGPGKLQPEQLEQVLDTGRLEPLTEDLRNELLLIRSENERLTVGEEVLAMADDDHVMHMRGHRGEMANPEARNNPQAITAYDAHMAQHWELYMTSDPARLAMFGIPPPPAPPQMMGPEGAPPAGTPGPPPEGPPGVSGPPPVPDAQMPVMPTNPLTGEQAPMAGPPAV